MSFVSYKFIFIPNHYKRKEEKLFFYETNSKGNELVVKFNKKLNILAANTQSQNYCNYDMLLYSMAKHIPHQSQESCITTTKLKVLIFLD
jgi:hypothetical protein